MSRLFDELDRLDLDGHVRRWSAPEAARADGDVNQWLLAAQMFAARLQQDPVEMPAGRWRAVGAAWSALMAAAERSAGPQGGEWLMRDLWLRAWLLTNVGPHPDVPLLDPRPLLDRALDALPVRREEAAELAPRWRELERGQILRLRQAKRLLAVTRAVAPHVGDHPRRAEHEAWQQLADNLP
ncbi:hypothetical protein QFZ75_002488 [Streptomyces sp. V3I8]|uniref:hypothetical protein n=1 Tax=Streptomyces sp. V3I8 TaxID=3042279 RepID=UPI002788CCDC|nr:hypothetical protein [Streptomyces sp. V3I8]MDQ1036072.1 hypothetical protein [Streptomyces sp. V3I8]